MILIDFYENDHLLFQQVLSPRTRSRPDMSSGAKTFLEISDIQEDDIAVKLATVSMPETGWLGPRPSF
jgi:hypothetical protein